MECCRLLLLVGGRTRLSVWLPCDWRKERSISASTARKSKRRFRVDSGEKRSRQREFIDVGVMAATRHRDAGAVSGGSENGDGGDNLSTREPKRSLFTGRHDP